MKWTGWGLALLISIGVAHAELPAEWKYIQQLEVAKPGLVKLSLPVATLGAARPGLEDLRLYDPAGAEVPYVVERPSRPEKVVRPAKGFEFYLTPEATVIQIETGLDQPLEAITLRTAAQNFIKAVQIEGSADKREWQIIATGQPVFHQPYGASELRLKILPAIWPFLRLTVDDRRSEPVAFAGAELQAAAQPAPQEPLPVSLSERSENGRQTRLSLNLGAANLTLASVRIETSAPLFMRRVTAATPAVAQDETGYERTLASGTLYRVAVEGAPVSTDLTLPLERQVKSRELLLLIDNQDNPPLPITAIEVQRRPVYATFLASQAGTYQLLTGNPRCPAPRYDLASLAASLSTAQVSTSTLNALVDNPSYRPGETLPEIQNLGTALDLSGWQFRKPVQIQQAGVVRLDLDLETLAGATPNGRDLRLVRDGKQQPYIQERTSVSGKLTPEVQPAPDPKKPSLSRWQLKLPFRGLPIAALTCASKTPLFQRNVFLFEEPTDRRGEKYRRPLGQANWVRRPPAREKMLEMTLSQTPLTDLIILETENGDNPPVELDHFQLTYRITRLLFKAPLAPETYLFYGNKDVIGAPHYDMSLVAAELFAAEKTVATLGPQENLKKTGWAETWQTTRTGSVLFWGALGLVVAVLLIVMARLLPKNPPRQ